MAKTKLVNAAKYALENFKCEHCETGIVQIFREWKRGGTIRSIVSGCMDCGHEYGLFQASKLEILPKEVEVCWP